MMNWKWNTPLQVTFRVYRSRDIFQIITFQCPMFTTGNCSWPKTCMPAPGVCLALLAASERAPGLLLLHSASSSPHQREPLTCAQVREPGCKNPTWTDIRKSHGLGGKPYKPKSLAVCYRTEISLLRCLQTQGNLSPSLFMAHAPTSHTWNGPSWQESPGLLQGEPHGVCREREWHPDGDEVCQQDIKQVSKLASEHLVLPTSSLPQCVCFIWQKIQRLGYSSRYFQKHLSLAFAFPLSLQL